MRNRAAGAIVVGLIFCLGACSSSSSKTVSQSAPNTTPRAPITTTSATLPPIQVQASLEVFFSSKGGTDLLEFEKISARLATGQTLTHQQCRPYIDALDRVGTPDYFIAQTANIPDPSLRQAFHDDVAAKRLYLAACDTGAPLPATAAPIIERYAKKLQTAMAAHGYAI